MRTITRNVYKFSELSDSAGEKAREWWREGQLDYDWWEYTYDWFEEICQAIGIDLDTKPVKLMNGKTRYDPRIYFSGFCSQGDGACFGGRYAYKRGCKKAVREVCGDKVVHGIVDELVDAQRERGYKLVCDIKHSGRYCHEYTMRFELVDDLPYRASSEERIGEAMRDLARWLYRQLEAEHDYLPSDESCLESMEANGYEFYEDGTRA
jgi:hypothetical protein